MNCVNLNDKKNYKNEFIIQYVNKLFKKDKENILKFVKWENIVIIFENIIKNKYNLFKFKPNEYKPIKPIVIKSP